MTVWLWIGFVAIVLALLAIDLGVFHRRSHTVTVSEAVVWTCVWVALSLVFNVCIYFLYEHHIFGVGDVIGRELSGKQAALEFFTGYLIEKSLSLDNIFVIALIFVYFGVPAEQQHRVLFWGILGALIMRGAMIAAGAALIHRFTWITYVFGGILIITAIRMLLSHHEKVEPENNPLVRLARKCFPVSDGFVGKHFFTRIDGRRAITPLLLVLLVVESTDVLFAVDSIPAIFAVTYDPFIVFTSNIFAILGLRAFYFVLAGAMDKFRYLKISLVVLLAFVGVKMLLAHHFPIPTWVSLLIIGGILAIGVVASLVATSVDGAKLATGLNEVAAYSWRKVRRGVIIVIGVTVVLIGIALIVLPGPAVVVIPAGLAILGTEFVWARRLLAKFKLARDPDAPPPTTESNPATSE
ncbi:MAG: TerC/Alx family metal homeostasis membrane protein [Phycisphaerales bacterium]|nr:TerC/Alx family metal homeostasis membrane protein [Phycisphaerales bacterium]